MFMLFLHTAQEASSILGCTQISSCHGVLVMWRQKAGHVMHGMRATSMMHEVGHGLSEPCVQAVPGSTQYEARSLAEQEKENLLTSEAVAQFLDRVWPR